MNYSELSENIKRKKSFLCVGLDSDIKKIPPHLLTLDDPVFEFNRQIVDATHSYAVSYKPNLAFYECRGAKGWQSLEKTVDYIRKNYPDIFLIADAKRGDIGNTSKMYAQAFFENFDFDAITVAPYMGEDSVTPFFEYAGKFVILLSLTSNKGAADFQYTIGFDNTRLFEKVIKTSKQWGSKESLMYVIGATKADMLKKVREIIPDHFILVPGVGAQGGSLHDVAEYGLNANCGLLVNSSRDIIFADCSENFAAKAGERAMKVQQEMEQELIKKGII